MIAIRAKVFAMEVGMVGLGRMGANMSERLARDGHRVIVFDRDPAAVARISDFVAASSLEDLVSRLQAPRVVWLMVPSGDAVNATAHALAGLLSRGDTVVDGGNSNYRDSIQRGRMFADLGIHFVDVGTSGGIWGLKEGYCLMIGGDEAAVDMLAPLFRSLAPAADRGWARVGPTGAGHFVKMVHNGIEYGMMQAYAEGFALLQKKADFNVDLAQVAELWRNGSVVRSWLLDLTAAAFEENPSLKGIAAYVEDSGEGRWMVSEAIAENVSIPVITLALLERIQSRDPDAFASKVLAVMRNKFGGHGMKTE
jgi:6-phosphogluconate dehydrogenase